jgi:hypothetical protein
MYPIILIVEVMIIGLLTSQFSPYTSYVRTNVGFGEANYFDNIIGIVPVFATTDDRVRCSDGDLQVNVLQRINVPLHKIIPSLIVSQVKH